MTRSSPSLRYRSAMLICAAAWLAACSNPKPQVAEKPPAPRSHLVVHNLDTDVSGKGKRQIVAAHVDFSNKTGRSLDYVMFKTRAFNAEGREIPAMKSGAANAWLRIAGPIKPDSRTGSQRWEKVWAGAAVDCFRIEGAEVIYDDSSVEFYQMDQIDVDLATLQPAICQPVRERVARN